jgi:phosphatidylglycerophosphatase A
MTEQPSVQTAALKRRFIVLLATGAGAGNLRRAPGTVGTILAVPFSLGLNRVAAFSLPLALLILGGFIAAAVVLCTRAAQILGSKDPPAIIIDEIAGFLVANFANAAKVVPLIVAFTLFRVFDITKVFPAAQLERLPGGAGIVLDDVMAGIYTFIVLRVLVVFAVI